jgi:hypothetical protein
MNIKNLVMVSPNFPKNGKVVVVSKMASLDMGMIKIVMMSNFITPKFLNVRVLKLSHYFLFCVVLNLGPVVSLVICDDDNCIWHFSYIICYALVYVT